MSNDHPARSAQGLSGLSPRYCVDPALFDLEREQIFSREWFPIGYESDLPTVGSYFGVPILGQDCFCVRDETDRIHCFQNVCRHRGTQLCPSKCPSAAAGPATRSNPGEKARSSFVCDYHGWKYGLDGRLIAAPHMDDVEGFEKNEFGLLGIRCEVWNGMIFANVAETGPSNGDPEIPTLSRFLEPLDRIVNPRELNRFQRVATIDYDIAANWKLMFQNFSECYHCPSVHPQLTPLSDYRDSENEFESGPILGGPMRIRDDVQSITGNGCFTGAIPEILQSEPGKAEQKKAHYYTVFPGLFLSLFPDYVMVHRLMPLATDRTIIRCDFLFHETTVASEGFDARNASEFWDQTNRQDWEMCERVQRGITQPRFSPSPYSNLESLLVAFDEFYLQRMAKIQGTVS